jgi:hypothetical protein
MTISLSIRSPSVVSGQMPAKISRGLPNLVLIQSRAKAGRRVVATNSISAR